MSDLELAAEKLENTDYSLVVVNNQEVLAKRKDRGVGGILELYDKNPQILANSAVADKIIGRAVAMICELGGVKSCYTPTISQGAVEILQRAEIKYETEKKVAAIRNREDTGLCPIEQLTLGLEDSEKAVQKIKEFLHK